jgi:hypothetical protein
MLQEFAFSARNKAQVAKGEAKQKRQEFQNLKAAGAGGDYMRKLEAESEDLEELGKLWDMRADVAEEGFWLVDPADARFTLDKKYQNIQLQAAKEGRMRYPERDSHGRLQTGVAVQPGFKARPFTIPG